MATPWLLPLPRCIESHSYRYALGRGLTGPSQITELATCGVSRPEYPARGQLPRRHGCCPRTSEAAAWLHSCSCATARDLAEPELRGACSLQRAHRSIPQRVHPHGKPRACGMGGLPPLWHCCQQRMLITVAPRRRLQSCPQGGGPSACSQAPVLPGPGICRVVSARDQLLGPVSLLEDLSWYFIVAQELARARLQVP